MQCPKYGFAITAVLIRSYCVNCADGCEGVTRPTRAFIAVDPFALARGIAEKKEADRRRGTPLLSDCPECGHHSLFYDMHSDTYECLNLSCKGG